MAEPVGLWVEGIAGAFGLDRDGELIAPGAFDRGIADYMKNPVVAYMHAKTVIDGVNGPSGYVQLGVTTELRRTRDGLLWKAFIPRPAAGFLLDVWEKIRAGYMRGLSVGGKFFKQAGSNLLDRVDLTEISIAPTPINPETLITSVVEAFEAPSLTSCGESCALRIGQAGKSDPGTVDLSRALQVEALAADLGDLRELITERERRRRAGALASIRRDMDRLRTWSV